MIDPAFDPIVKELSVDLIKGIFTSTYEGAKTFQKWIGKKDNEHDFFGRKARKYVRQLEERYNRVKIFGMSAPLPLRDIFVRANILEKITESDYTQLDELEDHFSWDKKVFDIKKETLPGLDIVDSKQKFIVLGKPGAGKTTFLKRIVLYAIDGELEEKRIPVFIGLKDWSESRMSLLDFIINEFSICQFEEARPFIELHLEKGKMLVLLDGLDEVIKEKENFVIKELKNFSDKYRDNQFIISCRIHAFNAYFEQFSDVEMADFGDVEIMGFIYNWFKNEPKAAKKCWDALKKDKQIHELAQVPLLLTLLCIAYDEANEFPINRADLYTEATTALLKTWDSKRRISRDEIYKGLSISRKNTLLSYLAFHAFKEGKYFLSQRKWENRILEFIIDLPNTDEKNLDMDSEAILKSLVAQHGIIVPRAKHIYSFSHLTFQEYYTAKYIADRPELVEKVVEEYLQDNHWKEVFLLLSGMVINSDNLLLLLKQRTESYATKNAISHILTKVSTAIKSDHSHKVVGRGLALSYILNFAYALNGNLVISNLLEGIRSFESSLARDLDRVLALEIERAIDRDHDIDRAVRLSHERVLYFDQVRNIEQTIDKSLANDIAQDLIEYLDENTLKDFEKYIWASHILFECLQAAHMSSKILREKILAELLMVPSENPN